MFAEKFIQKSEFTPSAEFPNHKAYADDYNARKVASDKAEEEKAKADTSPLLTLKRISLSRNQSGSYAYQIVSGLSDELKAKCRLYGRDERKDTIFYSAVKKGETDSTDAGVIVPKEFQARVHLIEDKNETLASGAENTNLGKFNLVFLRTASVIAKTEERQDLVRDGFKAMNALGIKRDTVLVKGTITELLAKESARAMVAQAFNGKAQPAPEESED